MSGRFYVPSCPALFDARSISGLLVGGIILHVYSVVLMPVLPLPFSVVSPTSLASMMPSAYLLRLSSCR